MNMSKFLIIISMIFLLMGCSSEKENFTLGFEIGDSKFEMAGAE